MVTADTFFTDMRYTVVKKLVIELNIVIYDMCQIENLHGKTNATNIDSSGRCFFSHKWKLL